MTWKRLTLATAFALAAALLPGSDARAAYTYSSSIVINSIGGSGGTIVNTPGTGATFTSTNGTVVNFANVGAPGTFIVPGTSTYNLGNLTVTTTSPSAEAFTVNYTDVVTITNPAPGGSTGTFTFSGTLTLAGVQFVGGASSGTVNNVYISPFTQASSPSVIGGAAFTLFLGTGAVNDFFGPPTINNPAAGGNIGGQITATVPEPSTTALSLIGIPVAVMLLRRRRAAA